MSRYARPMMFHKGMRVLVDLDGRPEPNLEAPGTVINVSEAQGRISVQLDNGEVTLQAFDRAIPE
jgi:hypothetical protein